MDQSVKEGPRNDTTGSPPFRQRAEGAAIPPGSLSFRGRFPGVSLRSTPGLWLSSLRDGGGLKRPFGTERGERRAHWSRYTQRGGHRLGMPGGKKQNRRQVGGPGGGVRGNGGGPVI